MVNISSLQNASSEAPPDWEDGWDAELGFYAPVDVPLLIMCFLIINANSLVVILFCWKQPLRTPSNVFLASMAVSDGVSSVFGVPLLITCSATVSEGSCVPSVIFLRFSAVSTVLHLLIIAFDRYGLIVHPLKYPSYISYGKAIVAVLAAYLTSLIVAMIQLSWLNVESLNVEEDASNRIIEIEKLFFIICLVVFFVVPAISMCYFYGHILVISLRHNRAILRQRGRSGFTRALGECRGTLVLSAMLVIFVACWLPYFVLGLQHHMGDELFMIPIWFEHLMVFLRFTPPLANPLLCTFCKQDFKQALRSWIKMIQRYFVSRYAMNRTKQPPVRITYNTTTSEGSRVVLTIENSFEDTRDRVIQSVRSNSPENQYLHV